MEITTFGNLQEGDKFLTPLVLEKYLRTKTGQYTATDNFGGLYSMNSGAQVLVYSEPKTFTCDGLSYGVIERFYVIKKSGTYFCSVWAESSKEEECLKRAQELVEILNTRC